MHTAARLRVAASIGAITILAACGGSDSTGPSPSQLAQHFDSLYVDAYGQQEAHPGYGVRASLMAIFEVPPALGASPSSITVTTASGDEHWKAFEFSELFSGGVDSGFAILAYRESNAHTALLIQFNGDGSIHGGALITNDTLSAHITDGDGETTLLSTGSSCATPSTSLENPLLQNLFISSCTSAKFRTSLSLTTSPSSSIDPALASLHLSNVTVNGVRIVDEADEAPVRRIRALLRTAGANNKF